VITEFKVNLDELHNDSTTITFHRGFPCSQNRQPSYNCAAGKTTPKGVISLTFFPFM
jgi:hypothetical protein